jgi:Transcription factor WhiB
VARARVIRAADSSCATSYNNEHWTARASCSSLDPKYFEYFERAKIKDNSYKKSVVQEGRLKAVPMSTREVNMHLLTQGQKVCHSCPVRQECLEAASPSERYWTVRGGLLPGILFVSMKNYKGPKLSIVEYLDATM